MFNQQKIHEDVQEHFLLNSYVDLAINYDMDNQFIARVKILKIDYSKNLLMMYQPGESKARKDQLVNISTLYLRESRISLFGKVVRAEANFFVMKYKPEIVLINLRRGFRENPKILFDINGKVEIFEKERLVSDKFILNDLSITGIGFLLKSELKEDEWDKKFFNKKLNIEGRVHLNFVNKKKQITYVVSEMVTLVRVIKTSHQFLEGYDFLGKISDDIRKIVMESQIAHKQAEIKYYD